MIPFHLVANLDRYLIYGFLPINPPRNDQLPIHTDYHKFQDLNKSDNHHKNK